jgi:hypothetical protein
VTGWRGSERFGKGGGRLAGRRRSGAEPGEAGLKPPSGRSGGGGAGLRAGASLGCVLARELPQEGTCDFVEMLPRSSEGTSWEGGACWREVTGQDAAFQHERHMDPEASSTRDSAPVCRVVRSLLR